MCLHTLNINSGVHNFINEFVSGVNQQHHRVLQQGWPGGARGHPDCPTLVIIVFDAIIVLFSVLSGVHFNGWTISENARK